MDEVKVSGLEELERHLQQVTLSPDTQLDAKLFDDVELQLNGKSNLPKLEFWVEP
jgi:hypothetical protein